MRGIPLRPLAHSDATESPPHMRGIRCDSLLRVFTSRVHPRVCGELTLHYTGRTTPAYAGSTCSCDRLSPRGRITPAYARNTLTLCLPNFLPRFTPAHAGNTPRIVGMKPFCRVHPRVCGEHTVWADAPVRVRGSPLRMQGEQQSERQ